MGEGLGKTTGWIHRASLTMRGVKMLNSVSYRLIDDEGLHITRAEQDSCLPVDTVVICAGQEPRRELQQPLLAMGKTVHLIGGADVAAELDARRAIDQGTRLAMALKRAHSALGHHAQRRAPDFTALKITNFLFEATSVQLPNRRLSFW